MTRASSPEDKRHHRRYDVEGLGLRGSLRLSMEATVLNLSLDGMALETHSWLSVGREYRFTVLRGEETLTLPGEVMWCNLVRTTRDSRGETLPVYRAGVEFHDVLSDNARQVKDFIHDNAVVHLESTRLFGRFQMPENRTDVKVEEDFLVRRVSFSGMLIETDFVPELEDCFRVELASEEGPLSLEVRVAYVQSPSDAEGRAEVGVEFLNLQDEDEALLARVIGRDPSEASDSSAPEAED